ncbi:hypothetical protein K491DRAFT_86222 [Lophiostoma macrostomum CBS 122681]|uniref:Uncharacterized protein n=1 Tax=Lophiostoma macrostomum CBS 122681 TaxID=1314788 RepID=A0A6A6SV29_9PLEO|nr:hypothetical protein K491DRAFT_86222 [Lophiostoma macrostomum CBS 122681]
MCSHHFLVAMDRARPSKVRHGHGSLGGCTKTFRIPDIHFLPYQAVSCYASYLTHRANSSHHAARVPCDAGLLQAFPPFTSSFLQSLLSTVAPAKDAAVRRLRVTLGLMTAAFPLTLLFTRLSWLAFLYCSFSFLGGRSYRRLGRCSYSPRAACGSGADTGFHSFGIILVH